ncbi:MAG TPA: fused MFS/spermidine synthase [Coleofasciculaceae cyanobacterium]|jgi:spermidine synthase/MFS family permease
MHKKYFTLKTSRTAIVLYLLFLISGFTALLYQVVWQRMLGLFSGSDVRSLTIVVASYLLGLGLGGLTGGWLSDRLSRQSAVKAYGFCNLGIAVFAILSRFLFYNLLFRQLGTLADSMTWTMLIVFISLIIPTLLMGLSLPLLSKAISYSADQAAPQIGLLYGVNTLGSGIGTLFGGWYIIGTLGYEWTVYWGATLSVLVGLIALRIALQFDRTGGNYGTPTSDLTLPHPTVARSVFEWCLLVFSSGFAAVSLEIIWFRVLDTVLQSIAYTYAHLLAFILVSNALGSLLGARFVQFIRNPRQVFLWIQATVAAYSLIAIWLLSLYWQSHPTDLRLDIGYIDPKDITSAVLFKYVILPLVMMVPPNLLLGFYFPLVQQAVQTDDRQIGQRVGLIQIANILGNTAGSLLTGLVFLDKWGTANSLRLLALLGLGFVLCDLSNWGKAKISSGLAVVLMAIVVAFPSNTRLWSALHGIQPQQYFITAEDSTGVAAVTEANHQGTLLASGQAQANFPYLPVHALLGSLPALIHPHPVQVMIIGLGSGGTAHTIGVNPLTQSVQVIELLGAELNVLREYAKTAVGQPLRFLFHDPRYQFIVGDGRRELTRSKGQFDIIETDAIYPWRSRAGMLYSQEFFQEVQSHLAPGGIFVEWNVGSGVEQTFRNVFPYVTQLSMSGGLYMLMGSDRPVNFNRPNLLNQFNSPAVLSFLDKAGVDVPAIRQAVATADVQMYSHAKDGQPEPINTDLFPRSEYYLNQSSSL